MSIVLIGPWCAGKTTVGTQMSLATGLPFIDIDDALPRYGAEIGWSIDHLIRRNEEVGMLASEAEWEDVREYAVRRVLDGHDQAVVALGASYTGYTEPAHAEGVRQTLADHMPILLTPSNDDDEAARICWDRAVADRGREWAEARADFMSWSPTELDRQVARAVTLTR